MMHHENAQPELVLLDDNELLMVAMRRWLKREMGWDAHCFTDPHDALSYLEAHQNVDIIIADLHMPVMNGIDFLEQAQQYHDEAIQILMTGFDYHDAVVGAINRLNLYFFLEKPWDSQKLELILHNAWEKRRLSTAFESQLTEVQTTLEKLRVTQDDLNRHKNQATIGRLIQGICHNLNSPLGVIVGQCQVLQMRLQEATSENVPLGAIRSSLNDINEASERMRNIIRNLMVKSRMEQTTERQSIAVGKFIRQELAFLQADPFLKYKVKCDLALLDEAGNEPQLLMNYADFSQIFSNLVRNALDAMSDVEEPVLSVRLRVEDNHVWIEVHDNGPGVEESLRAQIFEPFFTTKVPVESSAQALATDPSQPPRGSGLGLNSAMDLLAPYKGIIEVDDSDLGGACFRVKLPHASDVSPAHESSSRAI